MAEGGELGRAGDRARVVHGSRPLIAMTRPAKTVAMHHRDEEAGESDEQQHAHERGAAPGDAHAAPGPGRVPSGVDDVAGCGVDVPVKALGSSCVRAPGCERHSMPPTGAA